MQESEKRIKHTWDTFRPSSIYCHLVSFGAFVSKGLKVKKVVHKVENGLILGTQMY